MFKRPNLKNGSRGRFDDGQVWYSNDTMIVLWELGKVAKDRAEMNLAVAERCVTADYVTVIRKKSRRFKLLKPFIL